MKLLCVNTDRTPALLPNLKSHLCSSSNSKQPWVWRSVWWHW